MPVSCQHCGETWRRDPALEVPCPSCLAPIGRACRRPSGHNVWTAAGRICRARDQAALDAGKLTPCRGGPPKPPVPKYPVRP
jgi:hypothetical protein